MTAYRIEYSECYSALTYELMNVIEQSNVIKKETAFESKALL